LKGQQAALISARDLARRQIAEIASADLRLARRSAQFGRAASARLAATTAAAREALAACPAEAAEAALQRTRVEVLAQQRFATFTQRDRVRAVAAATQYRCAALGDQADALAIETRAAGRGLYLAGAAMDAPYGVQQRDRLLLRRHDLENIVADADSRLAELALQIVTEAERLARASAFDAQLPAGTVVWSQPAPKGTTVAPMFGLNRALARAGIVAAVACVVGAYLHWRVSSTIPWGAGWFRLGFALLCLGIELFGLFDAAILFAGLARRTDRSAEADAGEARLAARAPHAWPAVDLIIATYNEPIEVLEKTILGALALDWPNINVWVADDGRRAWLRDFCQAKGAGYITRPDNLHAKAGNINHALKVTDAPFVAVFDANFVPQRGFLKRTMGFFDDPAIGIVRVPHSFYNHDPLQQNLALREALPDDQRFFFEAIMPGRDGWDAAFCCGSNSITRRTAIDAIGGGLPAGSITEDMLLSLALLQKGFVTRYLNEPLAFGLAPESLDAFFVQRARWAQGAMQILFLKCGPLGPGHALRHRLFFLPTAWLSQALMMMLSVVSPLVFLFFDVPPLVGVTAQSAMFFLVPMVLAQVGGIVLLGGGRYFPIAAQVLGTFQSFRLLPVIIKTLFNRTRQGWTR